MADENLNELASGWVDTINEAGELQAQAVETEGNLQSERLYEVGNEAESWAVGDINQRPEGSAKHWAEITKNTRVFPFQPILLPFKPENLNILGLVEADGTIYSANGIYTSAIEQAAKLVTLEPQMFITQTEYNYWITNTGECGKFVYDATNKTLRVPTLRGHIKGGASDLTMGSIQEAGLPNITGEFDTARVLIQDVENTGLFTSTNLAGTSGGGSDNRWKKHFVFDASKANAIYGKSSTVDVQAVQYRWYIVLGNIVVNEIPIDLSKQWIEIINALVDEKIVEINTAGETQLQKAESWAIGTIEERPEGSAKYWAETINPSNLVAHDLSNISLNATTMNLKNGTHTMEITGNTLFVLPNPINNQFNQIEVMIKMDIVFTIDVGVNVEWVNDNALDLSTAGSYTLIWKYDPLKLKWICGGYRNGI